MRINRKKSIWKMLTVGSLLSILAIKIDKRDGKVLVGCLSIGSRWHLFELRMRNWGQLDFYIQCNFIDSQSSRQWEIIFSIFQPFFVWFLHFDDSSRFDLCQFQIMNQPPGRSLKRRRKETNCGIMSSSKVAHYDDRGTENKDELVACIQ